MRYLVTWQIDVDEADADDAKDAARVARLAQRSNRSIASVFIVEDRDTGQRVEVDFWTDTVRPLQET